MVDQVAGAQVVDQVAGVHVVMNQVAGTQVVDDCKCALHIDARQHTPLVVTPTDSLCHLRQLI